jgi:DNA-cytosine methyltransferase
MDEGAAMTLRAASCFSGIGAPEVAMPNWDWLWCAEIEKFPSAVMAARHPDSVNLGDVTADDFMQRASSFGQLDVLCAGSPCQSFSVAGLRKGMDDPRGNLTLRLLAIVDATKPKCLLWENVPGILSDKSNAFGQFLDALEELGYIYDADILDAQWFGLAQRRRRVFVCAHRLEDILQQRTITSALIVIQLLTECLLLILAAVRPSSMIDSESLAFNAGEPEHSLSKRMLQFGMDSQPERVLQLAAILDATLPLSERALSDWDWVDGSVRSKPTKVTKSSPSTIQMAQQGEFQNTDKSWSSILGATFQIVNECITSTVKSPITELKIFGCAQMTALITAHITPSMASQPTFWNAALSTSTAMKAFTDYARQTTSDLFADPKFIRLWSDFITKAERSNNSVADIAVECFNEILPVSESLHWNPPTRRKARKDVAGTIAARTKGGGGEELAATLSARASYDRGDGSEPIVAMCLNAGAMQRLDPTFETLIPTNRCDFDDADLAHTLRGEGFDASDDGTGRGTPLVPEIRAVAPTLTGNYGKQPDNSASNAGPMLIPMFGIDYENNASDSEEAMGPLLSGSRSGGGRPLPAIAIQSGALRENPNSGPDGIGVHPTLTRRHHASVATFQETTDCLTSSYGTKWNGNAAASNGSLFALQSGWQVRRLTPVECERLQGFPDNFTNIEYRGRPAADGPRYKALGNSWAVPVGRWIMERIERFMP